jgi:CYTH domain-containing protein
MSINRRFLIAPSLSRLIRKERGASRVTEGYFPNHPGRSSHVQVEGGSCNLILITASGGGMPVEERTEVPRAHADALLDVAPGKVVYDRSRMNLSGREIFVDRFSLPGPLDVVAIGFENEEAARGFRQPSWFGPEVTSEQAYQTRSIALEGAPTPPEVALSNSALDSLLDAFENRFTPAADTRYGSQRRPAAAGRPQAAPQQAMSSEALARVGTPPAEAAPAAAPRPDESASPAASEAASGSDQTDNIEDDVIRELARALGR